MKEINHQARGYVRYQVLYAINDQARDQVSDQAQRQVRDQVSFTMLKDLNAQVYHLLLTHIK